MSDVSTVSIQRRPWARRIDQLEKLVADFRRALFGARSEKTDPEQFELALEDIETAMAVVHAKDAALDPPASRATKPHNTNRGSLPKHLPRIEEVIEPEQTLCGCGVERHVIGEDTSERLDIIPTQFVLNHHSTILLADLHLQHATSHMT